MTTYYDDMSESAALNFLAGTTDFGDASAIRRIAAYIDAATGSGSPEGAVTGNVGDLYTDYTNGHLYIKGSGAGTNTGWVQIESATSGSGDVNGPGSATDNALVRFDGTGGKTVQNSGITVGDSGNVTSDLTIAKADPVLTVSASSGGGNIFFSAAASGQSANLRFQTNGVSRWIVGKEGTAEAGSDVGSNFGIYARTDAGSAKRTDLIIARDTGKWTLGSVGASAGLELGSSGPRVMSGTGSPEGVVTAPVGSTWIDTAATTGAIKWVKASGTGNIGWKVEYGDTGRRNLTAALENSWTASSVSLQRSGNMVTMWARGLVGTSASSSTFYTLPVGFRPTADYVPFAAAQSGSTYAAGYGSVDTSGGVSAGGTLASYSAGRMLVSFPTADAWPSSLPGTA